MSGRAAGTVYLELRDKNARHLRVCGAVQRDAVSRLGRRLAYCLYLRHHREGSRLQVCQAALA